MSDITPIQSGYLDPLAGSSEAVSSQVKQQYDSLLKAMQEILLKPSSSLAEEDVQEFNDLLGQLRNLQKGGITPEMADFANLLTALIPYNASQGTFQCDLTTLKSLPDITITMGGNKVSLTQALGMNIDPTATSTLGDSLIDGANWIYGMYTDQLKDLKKQLDIAATSLNNLQGIINTLNMTKTGNPGNYVYPPKKWDDIPTELQDQIKNDHPEWFLTNTKYDSYKQDLSSDTLQSIKNDLKDKGAVKKEDYPPWDQLSAATKTKIFNDLTASGKMSSTPTNLNTVLTFTKSDAYIKMSETYFNKVETQIPDPQPNATEALDKLLNQRDALQDQIDKFDQINKDHPGSVDTGEGSPYATTKQVLADLNQYFPPDVYPKGCIISDEKKVIKTGEIGEGAIGIGKTKTITVTVITKPDGTKLEINPLTPISAYINAGQVPNNPIKNHIDAAVSANQNLSSKMSDEIKAKNTTFQEFFDIFTALMDALNKILLSAARGK